MSEMARTYQPAEAYRAKILPERARATVRNRWLAKRLETVLPEVMAREGFDCWIISAREYNEDPVIMSLLPEPYMYARRRTILAFFRQPDGTFERMTLARYPIVGPDERSDVLFAGPAAGAGAGPQQFYEAVWDPDAEEQWACLARLVRERDPRTIGINVSETFAFGDGLSKGEHQQLVAALGPALASRTKGAERVAVGWLERRLPEEIDTYSGIVEIAHAVIAEGFSSRVILPGVTTTDDVVWWMRQKVTDLGLRSWFQPSVTIQAPDMGAPASGGRSGPRRKVIRPGDLLHCDFGLVYLGLCTDNQQNAYVLKPGESAPPAGLEQALVAGNRLQDIHLEAMILGRTGNDILSAALAKARHEGLRPQIYTHPLGYHGHAAGPTIGLWDQQDGVPGRGDYELFDDTVHSIELNVGFDVPEWDGQTIRMALEEDAVITGRQAIWLDGRQTKLYLIR